MHRKKENKSVSFGFYNELEALAIEHKICEIILRNEHGAKTIFRDSIHDLFSEEGIEYLETGKGSKLRLDRLVLVDGKAPRNQC
jgi:hypothetical protein